MHLTAKQKIHKHIHSRRNAKSLLLIENVLDKKAFQEFKSTHKVTVKVLNWKFIIKLMFRDNRYRVMIFAVNPSVAKRNIINYFKYAPYLCIRCFEVMEFDNIAIYYLYLKHKPNVFFANGIPNDRASV